MENLNEVLEKLTEFLKSEVKTETIIGQQFQLGEFTCVPVINVGLGLGTGGGEGKGNSKKTGEGEGVGAGGGAGIGMGPVGFLVTNGGEIQFIPTRTSKGLGALVEKVPDIFERYFNKEKEPVHA
ncbi:GerW family sporulation protein [Mucilaginibacter gotjawali]|uniref:Sporulation protein YtfJ n=2 Tax=Mucilaginibacter gotjawali TaxID=1550579 RepID=A0A110B259_9SPHI|nr:GerW family sporulation protein [Mucilaginibacter gotjawali]MBB3055313.1 putative spore protein YtfJ [Mucilaginibacter gotjawali]BAU53410.1 sporulation protein YtfJ [Mucilaginibacter gotjawali]